MINIVSYLTEKFKISSDTLSTNSLVAKAYDLNDKIASTVKYVSLENPGPTDRQKMKDYYNKGSKPSRLVNSIKDNIKLERRFVAAIDMDWSEAVDEFGKALIDRVDYYDETSIVAYIYRRLKNSGKIKS